MAEQATLHLTSVLAALQRIEPFGSAPRCLGARRDLLQKWLQKIRQAVRAIESLETWSSAHVVARLDGGAVLLAGSTGEEVTTVVWYDCVAKTVEVVRLPATAVRSGKFGPGGHVQILIPERRERALRRRFRVPSGHLGVYLWKVREHGSCSDRVD